MVEYCNAKLALSYRPVISICPTVADSVWRLPAKKCWVISVQTFFCRAHLLFCILKKSSFINGKFISLLLRDLLCIVEWCHGYLVVVSKKEESSGDSRASSSDSLGGDMQIITIYDVRNKLIAYYGPVQEVKALLYEWGSVFVLCNDNKVSVHSYPRIVADFFSYFLKIFWKFMKFLVESVSKIIIYRELRAQ